MCCVSEHKQTNKTRTERRMSDELSEITKVITHPQLRKMNFNFSSQSALTHEE
jgi:hypothetical protein